jgi:hypothetical protein
MYHPLAVHRAEVQGALHGGQRDGHHGQVEDHHELGDADHAHGEPAPPLAHVAR